MLNRTKEVFPSIGKLLNDVTAREINPSFKKNSIGDALITQTDDVTRYLSTDQFYGYKIVSAISSGNTPKNLALFEIGPVNHSRWLTIANRLCRIWVSKHELESKDLKNLELIFELIFLTILLFLIFYYQGIVHHIATPLR